MSQLPSSHPCCCLPLHPLPLQTSSPAGSPTSCATRPLRYGGKGEQAGGGRGLEVPLEGSKCRLGQCSAATSQALPACLPACRQLRLDAQYASNAGQLAPACCLPS